MSQVVKDALNLVAEGQDLTAEQTRAVFRSLMRGEVEDALIGQFLIKLAEKGETADEVYGAATVMREMSDIASGVNLLDTCGMGGDGAELFNVSTAAAIVVAACGARVAKHGNRAFSSKTGSADVLQELGVNINLSADEVTRCIKEVGIGFLYAPIHHPAMKNVASARQQIGIPTIFNMLGPLTNPAATNYQLLGASSPKRSELIAKALVKLGCAHALVVHSEDGLDEISSEAATTCLEIRNSKLIGTQIIRPEEYDELIGPNRGGPQTPEYAETAGNPKESAAILMNAIGPISIPRAQSAEKKVALNAGATLYVHGTAPTVKEGVAMAVKAMNSGLPRKKLTQWAEFTQKFGTTKASMSLLAKILAHKRQEVELAKVQVSQAELESRAESAQKDRRDFIAALQSATDSGEAAIIAELKKASPSAGILSPNYDPATIAKKYEHGGAACLSVLTDRKYFQGDPDHLIQAKQATGLPVLRKDFIVDEYQVYESAAMGADAILLISKVIRSVAELEYLMDLARQFEMAIILEFHDTGELNSAADLIHREDVLVGLNSRDLNTLEVDLKAILEILRASILSTESVRQRMVFESGISKPEEIQEYHSRGISKFLIGTALMKAPDPAAKLRELRGK